MHARRPQRISTWRTRRWKAFALVLLLNAAAAAAEPTVPIDFVRDIRPIFAKHCLACHGPKEEEGGLRLDVRSRAFAGGVSGAGVIVKGNAAESLLYQFVTGRNEDKILMPPKGKGERLSEAQCEIIRRWIDEGAIWPDDVAGSEQVSVKRSDRAPRQGRAIRVFCVRGPAVRLR